MAKLEEVAKLDQSDLQAARAAWPGVEVPLARWHAYVAEREPPGDSSRALHATDLYLASAVADGDAAALAHLDAVLHACVERAARRIGGDRALCDDILQRLRERLMLADGARRAGITEYSGRGSVRSWLHVVATREALGIRRREQRERPIGEETLDGLESPEGNPELTFLQTHYRAAFRSAFREAFAALEPLERDLLRRHHIDSATIDDLAQHHAVHRATAARWVARARGHLLTATRERLAALLRVGTDELDSILRLVQSRFEVTLRSQL